MASQKTNYYIQVVIILAVFSFVLFNLVFKLVIDMRSESIQKEADKFEKEQIKQEFIANIDDRYESLVELYTKKEFEKAIEIIKEFNKHGRSDYKDLPEIKKEIRLSALKKKIEFIPKIHLDDYMNLSKDIDIQEDDTTEVFIRTPRYGQFFYTSDFPIKLEGVALSVGGDFSNEIVWTSNIDGELGKGQTISVLNLSIGEHQITATGSNGITKGQMETLVFIEEEPEFLKDYKKK